MKTTVSLRNTLSQQNKKSRIQNTIGMQDKRKTPHMSEVLQRLASPQKHSKVMPITSDSPHSECHIHHLQVRSFLYLL